MGRNDTFARLIRRLAARRLDLGLSQGHVDQLLGIADGLVAKWEARHRVPSFFLLTCWADALECDLKLEPREDLDAR